MDAFFEPVKKQPVVRFPAQWAAALTDPSAQVRARAAREIPLPRFPSVAIQALLLDPEEMVVRGLLSNPTLNGAVARALYRRVVEEMKEPGRVVWARAVVEWLSLAGFSCPWTELREMRRQLEERGLERLTHSAERLQLMLRVHSDEMTTEFVQDLWPHATARVDLAVECIAHPQAGPELWRMAAEEALYRNCVGMGRAFAEVFALRPRSFLLPEVQTVVARFGGSEAQQALLLRGPGEGFRSMLLALLEEGRVREVGAGLREARPSQLSTLSSEDWRRLAAVAVPDVRAEVFRAHGRREGAREVSSSEVRPVVRVA